MSHFNSLLQLTVTGLNGMTGVTVRSRVVVECRIDQGLVPIPRHSSVERNALGKVTKRDPAMKILAQVNFVLFSSFRFLVSGTLILLLEISLISICRCS